MLYLQFRSLLMARIDLGPHREIRIAAGCLHADGRLHARFRAPYWEVGTAMFTGYDCAPPVLVALEARDGSRSAPAGPAMDHAMASATAYVGGRPYAEYDVGRSCWRDAAWREWVALLLIAPRLPRTSRDGAPRPCC